MSTISGDDWGLVENPPAYQLGELAAGVAHEINNPIYGVMNYAQLIVDESDKGSRTHEFGEAIC